MKKLIGALAFFTLLITTFGCGTAKTADSDYYTLNLKINPDVSFVVDDSNQVVGIVTNNDDARDVYNNIAFSSYDLDTVVNEWASLCTKMGFNTHNMEVGICGSDDNIEAFNDTWKQLKIDYKVFNADDIKSIDAQAEIPVCEYCGKQLFDVYETCPDCGHEVGYEVFDCFCGAKMATDKKPCPVCHLDNLTGEYEEGYGSTSSCRCFCGEADIDNATGVCPVCHLNNYTGMYEVGSDSQEPANYYAKDEVRAKILVI